MFDWDGEGINNSGGGGMVCLGLCILSFCISIVMINSDITSVCNAIVNPMCCAISLCNGLALSTTACT